MDERAMIDVFDPEPVHEHRMLHVLNGDSVRVTLEHADIPGTLTVWADVLHDGPVLPDLSDAEFRELRARFHADNGHVVEESGRDMQAGWDAGLASFTEYDEIILWFEHDLFDQLLLARHLDWFARQPLGDRTLSLICIAEFPGVERFHGLGELDAGQLASLLGTRQRVTQRQTELGRAAWRAFTGADPRAIERVIARDTGALPFLGAALERLLDEYPSVDNGLPRIERTTLELLVETGPRRLIELFPDLVAREDRPFISDLPWRDRLNALAGGPRPLIRLDGSSSEGWFDMIATITDDGRRVLAGEADWLALDPFDRWIGGVHLLGPTPGWRWDTHGRKLVSPTPPRPVRT